MAKLSCFSALVGKKKKYKEKEEPSYLGHHKKEIGTMQVKLEHSQKSLGADSTFFRVSTPIGIQENSSCKVKAVSNRSPAGIEGPKKTYEGDDVQDENSQIKRDFSEFDLQAQMANKPKETVLSVGKEMGSFDSIYTEMNNRSENKSEGDAEVGVELIQSGYISDPGIGKAAFWASRTLKRSCSNLETSEMLRKIAAQLPPNSDSFEDLKSLTEKLREETVARTRGSLLSKMSPCSADRVILKKHSSSQVLPSRSRSLWWNLFLWSHRNRHKPLKMKPKIHTIVHNSKQKGVFCSDTLEPNQATDTAKLESPGSFTGECIMKGNKYWDNFHGGVSGLLTQNQWVAFSTESPSRTRVEEWVNSLDTDDKVIVLPPPKTGGSLATNIININGHPKLNISEDLLHANTVIQSLNSSSTVAHITGMSLKVIPTMPHLSNLRSVNLSGNFIVRVTPGSLPKGLHTLNLSRNKIVAIEGLRELTRLRTLDLSYNNISRIGHGLSSCTLIKELYLTGNKISDMEGLHRLLKLTMLDLSFNKIATAKALGQLVANYNSLLALNLLGNPVQNNIGDDQLQKVISGFLPRLVYLNKQHTRTQRACDVAVDSGTKAALWSNGWTSHGKAPMQVVQCGSSSPRIHRSSLAGKQKSMQRSNSSIHHQSSMKQRSSPLASSSR